MKNFCSTLRLRASLAACVLAVVAYSYTAHLDALAVLLDRDHEGPQDGRPPALATGGSYRGKYFQFKYPSKWHVIHDGEDPNSPGLRW